MAHKKVCCGCSALAATSLLLWITTVWCWIIMAGMVTQYSKQQHLFERLDWLLEKYFYRVLVLNLLLIISFTGLLGLYGIYKKNPAFLAPFIAYRLISFVLRLVFFCPSIVYMYLDSDTFWELMVDFGFSRPQYYEKSFVFVFTAAFLTQLVFIAIDVWLWRITYTCYNILKEFSSKSDIIMLSSASPYWHSA